MKKSLKIVLIVLGIWLLMFITDFICVKTINRPIFMIRTLIYKDGGTKVYHGLFYKVIDYKVLDGDDSIHIGTWLMKYNPSAVQNRLINHALLFSSEYTSVADDNVFIYKNIDEIINILKHGTGIVYLGFPECKWCQAYVPMLNEVAKENSLDEIYYFNILADRTNNTEKYQEIVNILTDYLQYDKEGNKRVYVPSVIAIKEGRIVGFDDETAYDTKGYEDPKEYWNREIMNNLKEKLSDMIKKVNSNICTGCNE